jgi:hypothetical protein
VLTGSDGTGDVTATGLSCGVAEFARAGPPWATAGEEADAAGAAGAAAPRSEKPATSRITTAEDAAPAVSRPPPRCR